MISYFINNRISAFLVLAAFVTAGTLSMFRLPVSLLPSSEYPALSVIIEYPGITPDKIESLITRPVERILKTVSGISEIQSVSEEGKCRINITFSESTDIKIAALNFSEKAKSKILESGSQISNIIDEIKTNPSAKEVLILN